MHTIKLEVQDSIYDHIMFLLKNLNTKELRIIEEHIQSNDPVVEDAMQTQAFSNHSANLIEDWKDMGEDDIWR